MTEQVARMEITEGSGNQTVDVSVRRLAATLVTSGRRNAVKLAAGNPRMAVLRLLGVAQSHGDTGEGDLDAVAVIATRHRAATALAPRRSGETHCGHGDHFFHSNCSISATESAGLRASSRRVSNTSRASLTSLLSSMCWAPVRYS